MRLFLLSFSLLLASCSAPADIHETRFIMGTLVEFTVDASDREHAMDAIAAAAAEMQTIEDRFTIYGDSINAVKRLNHTPPGNPAELPTDVTAVLQTALDVQTQSLGTFTPALGGLNLLWGFSKPEPPSTPPAAGAVAAAIPPASCFIQQQKLWIREDSRCQLDFGGIAKGYAIDRGIAVLREHGIHNAIINAGGDIRLIGSHAGKPWRIGIRHPRKADEVVAKLSLQGDVSVVTSGDYERYYFYEDKRYHHLLDPATGMPAHRSQSATVIAENATLADAWSTALFVAGENGKMMVEQMQLKAMIVNAEGETVISTLEESRP